MTVVTVTYPREFFLAKRILGFFLALLYSSHCCALDQFSFKLGRITTEKWQLKGVDFSFSGILGDSQQFSLNIQSLRLPEPFDTIKLVNIHCPEVKFTEDTLKCQKGFADVQSDWLNSPRIPFSFYLGKKNSNVKLERIKIAGGTVFLIANIKNDLWQTNLRATNLKTGVVQKKLKLNLFEPVKGKLDVTVNAKGQGDNLSSVEAQMDLHQGNVQTRDGRIATEKLKLAATVRGRRKHNTWRFNSQVEFQDGAIYAEPVYLEAGTEPILIYVSGGWQEHSNKRIGILIPFPCL